MPEITLQDYLEEIDRLVDESRLAEAAAHSRHILEHFPRHVDTYRMLAKVILEQGEHEGAADLFRRVLSADPADFVAHIGMAIIHSAADRVEEALWHMERAYEMDPYNPTIQEELKGLYEKRDNVAPQRLELSRGALARLYVKGELYQLAITELSSLLDEDADRVDLHVLLAEALWRDQQRVDAVEVCLELLDRLPDCVKANAILADVWLLTGRTAEALEYLERLRELTQPSRATLGESGPVASAFRAEGAIPVPDKVTLPRLPEEMAIQPSMDEGAGWVDELHDDAEIVDDFAWLEALDGGGEEAIGGGWSEEEEEVEVIDWLRDVAVLGDEEIEEEPDLAEVVEEEGEFFEEESLADDGDDGEEVPAWLQGADESAFADLQDVAGEAEMEAPANKEISELQEEDSPFIPETEEEGPAAQPVVSAESEWPDEGWELDEETVEAEVDEFAEFAVGETMDLEEMAMSAADDQGNEHDEQEQTPDAVGSEAGADDSLDWLDELKDAEGVTPPDQEQSAALSAEADDLPDWLRDDIEGIEEAGSSLDWLGDTDEQSAAEEEAEDDLAPADIPDWLKEPEAEAAGAAADEAEEEPEEDLSWLDQIAAGAGSAIEEGPTMSWPEEEGEISDDALSPASQEESEAVPDQIPQEGPTAIADEVPEDLDEAMAWLERLAAQHGVPAEELPSLTEASDEEAAELLQKMVEDQESVTDWLEETSADQESAGTPEQEADQVDAESFVESADWLDELAIEEEVEGAEAGPEEDEEPDWLDELEVEEEPAEEWLDELVAAGEEEETVAVAAEGAEAAPEEDEELDWLDELEVEEEPDEEWLDELVAAGEEEETAAVAAAGTEAGPEEDEEPDWLDELEVEEEPDEEWLDELTAADEEEEMAVVAAEGAEAGPEEDEELDWLDELEVEEEPDEEWLDELVAAGEEEETATAAEASFDPSAETGIDLSDQVPEDLDEAMAWLEKLAAQQGASLDELPSLQQEELIAEGAAELDWLDDLEPVEEEDDLVAAGKATAEAQSDAPEMAEEFAGDAPEDLDEAMAWLEQLAAQQGASLDELPSVEALPEPEEALDWLDDLEAEAEPEEILRGTQPPAAEEALEEEVVAEELDDIPEDLDDAMAWLERLAAQQGAPLEELPSLQERQEEQPTAESIAELSDEIPDDPDAALAWLEEMIASEETEAPQVVEEPETPVAPHDVVAAQVEAEARRAREEAARREEEEAREAQEAEVPEPASIEAEIWEEAAEALAPDMGADLEETEIPEDPDEAIAWLEQLAARQGASLDELPSVERIEEDVVTPEWLSREMEKAEQAEEAAADREREAGAVVTPEAPVEGVADLEKPVTEEPEEEPAEEPAEEPEAEPADEMAEIEAPADGLDFLEEFDFDVGGEDLDDSLPDWLSGDVPDQADTEFDWDEAEADMASWLEAEEEVTQYDISVPEVPPARPKQTAPQPPLPEPATVEWPPLPPEGSTERKHLEKARQALQAADYESAAASYEEVLDSGEGLPVLIAELESATAHHPDQPGLRRLLGDVYMENGQLQKALESYRGALEQL